jgi:hypothetical protein
MWSDSAGPGTITNTKMQLQVLVERSGGIAPAFLTSALDGN